MSISMNADACGRPITTEFFPFIAPLCEDEGIWQEVQNWADSVELWVVYPCIPMPGPNGPWLGLLQNVIPSGSACVKFSKALGEKLKPWIPDALYSTVVASN